MVDIVEWLVGKILMSDETLMVGVWTQWYADSFKIHSLHRPRRSPPIRNIPRTTRTRSPRLRTAGNQRVTFVLAIITLEKSFIDAQTGGANIDRRYVIWSFG